MRLISFLLFLALSFCAHAEMYKWVDADGNITYSDRPQPGASNDDEVTEVTVPPVNTVPAVDTSVLDKSEETKQDNQPGAESISIISPQDDEAIRENAGNVSISVAVEPILVDETVAIYLDGNEVSRGQATNVYLQNIDRGTHIITAEVISAEGNIVASASPVTFHLLRYSSRN